MQVSYVYLVTLLHFPICYPVCGLFAVNSCFDMGALYLILLSSVLNLECKKGSIRRFLPVPALLQSKELVRFHFVSPLLSFLLHVVRLLHIVLVDGKRLMVEFFQQTVLNSNNGFVVTAFFFSILFFLLPFWLLSEGGLCSAIRPAKWSFLGDRNLVKIHENKEFAL